MGKPMAVNIVKAGFDLTVCDLQEERCRESALLGATVASSPGEIAKHSDIIEIVVVDDDQTERVVAGKQGLIHSARTGSDRRCLQHDPSCYCAKNRRRV